MMAEAFRECRMGELEKGDSTAHNITLSLRPITEHDLTFLDQWMHNIHAERYMSRCRPRADSVQVVWYAILVDNDAIGTVWLEKSRADSPVATLGILIGRPDLLGKGIGRSVIEMAIRHASPILHCTIVELNVRCDNHRAIACYQYCGFQVVGKGVKRGTDGSTITYLTMQRTEQK